MKKYTWKERLSYWFDNRMSSGNMGLIKLLAGVSLVVILLIALIIFGLSLNEEGGFLSALWNTLATVINAWMPYFDEGSPGYLLLTAAAAIVGLLVTSVLIGIVSSAIEEKITNLKRGTSVVIEAGHTVVLGFYPGEYSLLRQLVLAAAGKPVCIVVADDREQEEMEELIEENIEKPKNVRFICRTVDIFDPKALERCSIASCRSVIVSPTDDFRTTKALLAVSTLLDQEGCEDVRVCAIISKPQYSFPPSMAAKLRVTTLQTNEIIAKIIAHSCTQPGLSQTFREVFNFEGSELYAVEVPGAEGLNMEELLARMDRAVPLGICRGTKVTINPGPDMRAEAGDLILVFSEQKDSLCLKEMPALSGEAVEPLEETLKEESVTVIGENDTLDTVLRELPENVTKVLIADRNHRYRSEVLAIQEKRPGIEVSYFTEDLSRPGTLKALAERSDHILILSDHEADEDLTDMNSSFLLLNLRDIRESCGLTYNITAEMRREHNQSLVVMHDQTDFVVASNMSSLFLAQLSESPELMGAFRELLSNRGNELFLKSAALLQCEGERSVAEIRRRAYRQGYLVIGYIPAGEGSSRFNPSLEETLTLSADDKLIVIGEN